MKKIFYSNIVVLNILFANPFSTTVKNDSIYFVFNPPSLTINVGESARLNIKLIDKNKKLVTVPVSYTHLTLPTILLV